MKEISGNDKLDLDDLDLNILIDDENDFDDDVNFDTLNLNEPPPKNGNLEASSSEISLPKEQKYIDAHPKELIIGDTSKGVQTHSSLKNFCSNVIFLSQIEP